MLRAVAPCPQHYHGHTKHERQRSSGTETPAEQAAGHGTILPPAAPAARNSPHAADEEAEEAPDGGGIAERECKPFEHHDYIVLLLRDAQDFQGACERLHIGKAMFSVRGGKSKIGMVRVIDGAKAIDALTGAPAALG